MGFEKLLAMHRMRTRERLQHIRLRDAEGVCVSWEEDFGPRVLHPLAAQEPPLMPHYFTTPRKAWIADPFTEDDRPMTHVPTVSDHEATDTGLIDEHGNTIWRAPRAMGFVWSHD